jgi:hypothetical protein
MIGIDIRVYEYVIFLLLRLADQFRNEGLYIAFKDPPITTSSF